MVEFQTVNGMRCEVERPDTAVKYSYSDDENQIAREPVFRAERIPERIDRPLSAGFRWIVSICLKVIFRYMLRHVLFLIPYFSIVKPTEHHTFSSNILNSPVRGMEVFT